MHLRRAAAAGIAGCIVVLIVVWTVGRLTSTGGDLVALTAAVIFARTSGAAWIAGFIVQLVIGAVAGVVYAALFEWITRRGGAAIGFIVAVPHAVLAGLVLGFLPGERMMQAGVMPPGAFYEFHGIANVAAFVGAHLAFGIVMGVLYRRTRHALPADSRQWMEVART